MTTFATPPDLMAVPRRSALKQRKRYQQKSSGKRPLKRLRFVDDCKPDARSVSQNPHELTQMTASFSCRAGAATAAPVVRRCSAKRSPSSVFAIGADGGLVPMRITAHTASFHRESPALPKGTVMDVNPRLNIAGLELSLRCDESLSPVRRMVPSAMTGQFAMDPEATVYRADAHARSDVELLKQKMESVKLQTFRDRTGTETRFPGMWFGMPKKLEVSLDEDLLALPLVPNDRGFGGIVPSMAMAIRERAREENWPCMPLARVQTPLDAHWTQKVKALVHPSEHATIDMQMNVPPSMMGTVDSAAELYVSHAEFGTWLKTLNFPSSRSD